MLLSTREVGGRAASSLRIGDEIFTVSYTSTADQTPEGAMKLRT
jgi:hypothetical protein